MSVAVIIAYVAAGCAIVLGLAVALRAGHSLRRWSFAGGMFCVAVESALLALAASAKAPDTARYWQDWRLAALSAAPLAWLVFSVSYTHATGWQFLRKHRWLLGAAVVLPVAFIPFHGHALGEYLPSDPPHAFRLLPAGLVLYTGVLIAAVLIVMNMERTFRAAVGTARWRIKYLLLGVAVLFAVRIYTASQVLVFRSTSATLDSLDAVSLLVATPLMLRSFFRAGHFEVDVYPSAPALRNSLTILVAGVYLVIVGALAKVVAFLGGDAAFSIKALVVLIALVLQSDHAQLYARTFVSRHFRRPFHDYPAVWRRVTEATASCVEEPELCRAVSRLAADVFQALSVRMWLLNESGDTLCMTASTTASGSDGAPTSVRAADILAHFRRSAACVDLDHSGEAWCAALRECHPSEFPNGGHRICVPLHGRGDLVGVLTLGDRVGGVPFSTEDLELLKCISDHAAACLLNVHLSQRLLQAKQLEAFQAMAAFFVHDLKNAASTLNLMLKNLPVHFDDPEFRADALRGIGKTVEHIDGLIRRLSALRHELKVVPRDSDFNEIVAAALAGLGELPQSKLVKEMTPVPRIPVDPEQVHKVITNLVLNAAEAVPAGGRVRVSTSQENGWVVLTVDDNGCGMTEEFLERSLFRPFQTTKKNGLGIGMFQSKMIIEAHGGRIAVSSRPGCGTTFQVFLRTAPLAK